MATEIEILLSLSIAAKRANNLGRDTILAQALALLAIMGDERGRLRLQQGGARLERPARRRDRIGGY
jgi:hypothetical protein